jgi:threonine dehydratase
MTELAARVAAKTRGLPAAFHEHVRVTPFTSLGTTDILVKREHQQKTGSFKVRGALAKLLSLDADQRDRGVIAASTGNHGLGVAYALSVVGGNGVVCVPENASAVKTAAIRRYGVEVRFLGAHSGETEMLARRLAAKDELTYISPYNDLDVIAGQGSIGLEIIEQLAGRPLDAVVVAVGGGGLISGIAATVKSVLPHVRFIGASPANDAVLAASVRAGAITRVDARPTLSDATAGGVDDDAITLPLCTELVDEWILVDEAEIRAALRLMIDTEHELVEGSAAVAIAAALTAADRTHGQAIAVVSCGANISADALARALTA